MFTGLVMVAGSLFIGALGFGLGTIHGYDKWDKENEAFQRECK